MNYSGAYADVVFLNGQLHVVTAESGVVTCYNVDTGTVAWRVEAPEWGYLLFLAAGHSATGTKILATGKISNGSGVGIVGEGIKQFLPTGPGNYPASLRNGVVYILRGPNCDIGEVGRYLPDGTFIDKQSVPSDVAENTSQGIRFIADDGRVVYGDQTLSSTFAGQTLSEWMQRSGFTAGQGPRGGMTVVTPDGNWFDAITGNTLFPKLAVSGDRVAVLCTDAIAATSVESYTPPYPVTTTPAPPVLEDLMIKAFSHYGWVAPYFSHGKFGDTDDHVGNAILLVEDPADPNRLANDIARLHGNILILQGDGPTQMSEDQLNTCVAWWCSGRNAEELDNAVGRCEERPERAIIAYMDSDDWPAQRPAWVTEQVRPNVQAYRRPNEPLNAFKVRLEGVLERVKGYGRPFGISPRFDDFNGSGSVEQTLECMPLYEEWVRNYSLVDFLPFADRRGNGMAKVKALRDWGRAFLYAFPERPNRFNYWVPSASDKKSRIRNIAGQSRLAKVFEKDLLDYILELVEKDGNGGGGGGTNPPPAFEPRMPNKLSVVERLRNEFPAEWDAANAGPDYRFVRRLANELRKEDSNWGLVGQRLNANDIGEDVLSYLNPTVNPIYRNSEGQIVETPMDWRCEVVDFILAHGTPDARPGWLVITDELPPRGNGAGALWIKP